MLIPMTLALAACMPAQEPSEEPAAESVLGSDRPTPPPTFVDEAPRRLVAIGDVHGDFKAAKKVLRVAGVLDGDNNWVGGDTWIVQTGDQLDRADREEKILDLFERLADEAYAAGGAFHSLLGNHELMNVQLDFRFVTPGGYDDFADTEFDPEDELLATYPEEERGRVAAFRPGGEWATRLSDHNVVMVVGGTVLVHGGVLPESVDHGLAKLNNETRRWMRGRGTSLPGVASDIVWTRIYSDDDAEPDCVTLDETLDALGADRMVVAHTVWDTVNPACDGRLWRIDVGMSSYYGGDPMALEIAGDSVTILE